MFGDRKMAHAGYRWDVFARFPSSSCAVRIGVRVTKRGALRLSERFRQLNKVETHLRLRYDPLHDLGRQSKRRTR